jgi:hypothetical protein
MAGPRPGHHQRLWQDQQRLTEESGNLQADWLLFWQDDAPTAFREFSGEMLDSIQEWRVSLGGQGTPGGDAGTGPPPVTGYAHEGTANTAMADGGFTGTADG